MTRVATFLQPGWADWEVGPAAAVLRYHLGCELATYSPDGEQVKSIGGLALQPDGSFTDPAASLADVMLLIGADAWVGFESPALAESLNRHLERGGVVGVICAATAFAAKSGLFKNRRHTSNGREWLNDVAAGYTGSNSYVDTNRAVRDRTLVSAPGSAPQTFTFELMQLIAPDKVEAAHEYLALAGREFAA